jgi:hypothetical protein
LRLLLVALLALPVAAQQVEVDDFGLRLNAFEKEYDRLWRRYWGCPLDVILYNHAEQCSVATRQRDLEALRKAEEAALALFQNLERKKTKKEKREKRKRQQWKLRAYKLCLGNSP